MKNPSVRRETKHMTDSDRLVERTLSDGRLYSLADLASTAGLSTGEAAAALDKLVAQGLVRDYYTGLQTLYRLTGSKGKRTRLGAA